MRSVADDLHELAAMDRLNRHTMLLRSAGYELAAMGAGNLWLQHAIAFSATPAITREFAQFKISYLVSNAMGWADEAVTIEYTSNAVDMICAGVFAEAGKWRVDIGDTISPLRASHFGPPLAFDVTSREMGCYLESAERRTVANVVRDLTRTERSSLGDAAILWPTLFRVLATPAKFVAEIEAKQRALVRLQNLAQPDWLLDPIIGAALVADYRRVNPSPAQKRRLRAMLPRVETQH